MAGSQTIVLQHGAPKARRFRAYGPGAQTHAEIRSNKVVRVEHPTEEVVDEGRVTDNGFTVDGAKGATRVVVYAGPAEDEIVVGAAELNGATAITLTEAAAEEE